VSYVAGVLVSFSPCIYPLIPITLGVIGTANVKSRAQGFRISSLFVLGICCTYTILGIVASSFGLLFSNFFMNPFSFFLLGVFFVLFGLSSLDLIRVTMPFLRLDIPSKRQGAWLFVVGLISGLSIIPCNFPVLGAILTLISRKHDVSYGGLCLFVFSLGYGTLLLLLGTFSSLVSKLPKTGMGLIIIKKLIGIMFLIMAFYFFKQIIGR
jgi:cytochrome c-type biogenesis protein